MAQGCFSIGVVDGVVDCVVDCLGSEMSDGFPPYRCFFGYYGYGYSAVAGFSVLYVVSLVYIVLLLHSYWYFLLHSRSLRICFGVW